MDKHSNRVLIGIFLCLIVIALKPVPSFDSTPNSHITVDDYKGEEIVQLSDNRIAIIDARWNSGDHGKIIVLQFNEDTHKFEAISADNYLQYIQ